MRLNSLLSQKRVSLDISASNWEEVIEIGCAPLVEDNSIETSYVQSIKDVKNSIGPYFIIAPGIAVPHSRPESGVNRTAMTFLRLRTPVVFGHETNDPVKLVFTLATTNNEMHLESLRELTEVLMNKDSLHILENSNDLNEIMSVLHIDSKEGQND